MNSNQFLLAVKTVDTLSKTPNHNELSDLYGLYKQAILGDNNNIEQHASIACSTIYFKF